jgi:hypothetical protein
VVRPLTKRNVKGELYIRPSVVEAEIDGAMLDDLLTLRRRLLIVDKAASDYLRSETLVHLIRHAMLTGNAERRDVVLPVLLGRCEAILKGKVSYLLPNAEALREYVLSEFSELLAADGTGEQPDELDFYECRFNLAFYALRIDVVRRELEEVNGGATIPDENDSDEPQAYEDAVASLSTSLVNFETQQSPGYLEELLAAIDALPPDERKAVVLVHVMGYDEESEDPNKVTAATLCDCTGRTIRNRLSRAAAKLSRFKEDA